MRDRNNHLFSLNHYNLGLLTTPWCKLIGMIQAQFKRASEQEHKGTLITSLLLRRLWVVEPQERQWCIWGLRKSWNWKLIVAELSLSPFLLDYIYFGLFRIISSHCKLALFTWMEILPILVSEFYNSQLQWNDKNDFYFLWSQILKSQEMYLIGALWLPFKLQS